MIFVTVGTHEQQFDRLIRTIDDMKRDGKITEDVIIQTGFSTYEPKYCKWSSLYPYKEMIANAEAARIIITHGGPSSFIMALQIGKIPIVVPRQKEFDEHVNDHQVNFCREVAKRQGNIIEVEDMSELEKVIADYDSVIINMSSELVSNNSKFVENIKDIAERLVGDK